jgi:hypothetical protein
MIILITAASYGVAWEEHRAYVFTKHKPKRALNWAIASASRRWPGYTHYTAEVIDPKTDIRWLVSKAQQERGL